MNNYVAGRFGDVNKVPKYMCVLGGRRYQEADLKADDLLLRKLGRYGGEIVQIQGLWAT